MDGHLYFSLMEFLGETSCIMFLFLQFFPKIQVDFFVLLFVYKIKGLLLGDFNGNDVVLFVPRYRKYRKG